MASLLATVRRRISDSSVSFWQPSVARIIIRRRIIAVSYMEIGQILPKVVRISALIVSVAVNFDTSTGVQIDGSLMGMASGFR